MEEKLGKKITVEELKKIQIEILDVVADYCKKNKIQYFLEAGTLLGAVRHQGYIPWDDDIDIAMPRKDYDKFINNFNNQNERYKVFCVENNREFLYPYSKVLDTTTILYEPDRNGNKISINIDIFPVDNAPDEEKDLKRAYVNKEKYRTYSNMLNSDCSNKSIYKKIIIKTLRHVLPKDYFLKKMVKCAKKYNNKATKCVSSLTGYSNYCCDRKTIKEYTNVLFEGKEYKAPKGYDEWLKALFGDYMTLPPKEKRVSHHQFEAYIK